MLDTNDAASYSYRAKKVKATLYNTQDEEYHPNTCHNCVVNVFDATATVNNRTKVVHPKEH